MVFSMVACCAISSLQVRAILTPGPSKSCRCGPCLLMAPEFEEAAKELGDRVRFVKLDTDQEETMAARLNIMGLPTLLFLDKYEGEEGAPAAVLKGRIEGALQKQMIVDLCEHHFFDGPEPKMY
jgi:thiol-disulfide isomerase/thioredoxin